MLLSTHTKRDAIFATLFLTILSVTTFLCGFAVDHFLIQQQEQNQVHQMRRRGLRTSTHSTKDHKRNFEYCDQTWNDMDYNYPQFHEDAARKSIPLIWTSIIGMQFKKISYLNYHMPHPKSSLISDTLHTVSYTHLTLPTKA